MWEQEDNIPATPCWLLFQLFFSPASCLISVFFSPMPLSHSSPTLPLLLHISPSAFFLSSSISSPAIPPFSWSLLPLPCPLFSPFLLSSALLPLKLEEEEAVADRPSPLRSDSSTLCVTGRLGCPEHYLNTHTAPDTQTYTHIHSDSLCQSSPALSAQALLKLFFFSSLSLLEISPERWRNKDKRSQGKGRRGRSQGKEKENTTGSLLTCVPVQSFFCRKCFLL